MNRRDLGRVRWIGVDEYGNGCVDVFAIIKYIGIDECNEREGRRMPVVDIVEGHENEMKV